MSYLHWDKPLFGKFSNRREYAVPDFPGTTIIVEWNDEWNDDETHVTSAKLQITNGQTSLFSEEYEDGVPFYPDDQDELVEWVMRKGLLGDGAKRQLLQAKLDAAKAELAKFEAKDTITPIRKAILHAAATVDDTELLTTFASIRTVMDMHYGSQNRIESLKKWTIPPLEKELAACTPDTVQKLKQTLFSS